LPTIMSEQLSKPVGLDFLDLEVRFEGFAVTGAASGAFESLPTHRGCDSDTLNCGSVSGCQNTSSSFTRCQICT